MGSTDSELTEAPSRLETEKMRIFLSAEFVARYLGVYEFNRGIQAGCIPAAWVTGNIPNCTSPIDLDTVYWLRDV